MPRVSTIRLAGVTFREDYPNNLHRLREVMETTAAASVLSATAWSDIENQPETPAVVLRRDPANIHDSNAIEVHVPALGRMGFVGFIPKKINPPWAKRIDAGDCIIQAAVAFVAVDPAHPEKPGLEIRVEVHDSTCDLNINMPCTCGSGAVGPAPDWTL